MPASLSNQNISNTYQGLLHAQGDALPFLGRVVIADGSGKSTALSLGTAGQGIVVSGPAELGNVYATAATLSSLTMEGLAGIVSPNTPKAWAIFAGNNGELKSSYNVDSVVRPEAGKFNVIFTQSLATVYYVVQVSMQLNNAGTNSPFMVSSHVMSDYPPSTTSFWLKTYRMSASLAIQQFDPEKVFITVYHA